MKMVVMAILVLLITTASGTLVSDSIKNNYEKHADKEHPTMGLLEVRVDDVIPALGNDMMIIVTIDNATKWNVYDAVMTGGMAYIDAYMQYKSQLPDKAMIYVNKAGGILIGSGVVYKKWVDDWYASPNHYGQKGYSDAADRVFVMKMMNATNVWTWQL